MTNSLWVCATTQHVRIIEAGPKSLEEALAFAQTHEISLETLGPWNSNFHHFQNAQSSSNQQYQARAHRRRYNAQNQQKRGFTQNESTLCRNCNKPIYTHRNNECPAKYWKCHNCHKKGHVARRCRNEPHRTGQFEEQQDQRLGGIGEYTFLNHIGIQTEPPLYVYVNVNEINFKCEIDSGATISVISSVLYDKKNN